MPHRSDNNKRDTHALFHSLTQKGQPMFTLGQTIDTKSAKRLYVTTRDTREIGMYRKGLLSPVYCITLNQVIIGIFTEYSEANGRLQEVTEGIGFTQLDIEGQSSKVS